MTICHVYRAQGDLVAALVNDAVIAPYLAEIERELPGLAEQSLRDHLRSMHALVTQIGVKGFEQAKQDEPAAIDGLLTDMLAVATWHGWPLPLEDLGMHDKDVALARLGLLGYAELGNGAAVYCWDDGLIGLARDRSIDVDGGIIDPHAPT